jgi:hypothetical protein
MRNKEDAGDDEGKWNERVLSKIATRQLIELRKN